MKKQTKNTKTIEQTTNKPEKPLSKEERARQFQERVEELYINSGSGDENYDFIEDIAHLFDKNGIFIGSDTQPSPVKNDSKTSKLSPDEWEKIAKEAMSSNLDKPAVQVLQDMKAAKLKKSLN